jgi:hypothetical protein
MQRSSQCDLLEVMMHPYIETGVVVTACGSAIFWFLSAICRLPVIKPGTEELATITELNKALKKMSNRNFWAAGLMGLTALLAALARFIG